MVVEACGRALPAYLAIRDVSLRLRPVAMSNMPSCVMFGRLMDIVVWCVIRLCVIVC